MIVRMALFSLIVVGLYLAFQKFSKTKFDEAVSEDVADLEAHGLDSIFFLPTSTTGQIVRHKHFALSYHEEFELPEWVAFELTAQRLKMPWVKRTDDYRPDHKVSTGSADPDDYRRSGYDRGHLAAAADMAFSAVAMSETFFMSNMSPQRRGFNGGIWRELEELNRDWAKRFHHLYVVTGPVLAEQPEAWIGKNRVAVPRAFYRVILDLREPEKKGIAFVVPNEVTEERLETFATSIDKVEALTGLDFFPALMPPELEAKMEANFDPKLWPTNEKKYRLRVKKWNR